MENIADTLVNCAKELDIDKHLDTASVEELREFAASTPVHGFPLTREHRIIGALVARLGKMVKLTPSELSSVEGLQFEGNEAIGGITVEVTCAESDFSSISTLLAATH